MVYPPWARAGLWRLSNLPVLSRAQRRSARRRGAAAYGVAYLGSNDPSDALPCPKKVLPRGSLVGWDGELLSSA